MGIPSPRHSVRLPVAAGLAVFLAASTTGAGDPSGSTAVNPPRESDVYVLSHENSFFSSNASVSDIESLLKKKVTGDYLWVRRDGNELVIRDVQTLQDARQLFERLNGIELEREVLQEKHERLGEEEAALDDEEEELEEELEALEEREEHRVPDSVLASLEHRRDELNAQMRALNARQRELDADERAIDVRSDDLERDAESALWRLVDRAITKGLGRPIDSE